MQTIGKIIIDDELYSGKDLYSDGPIEDEMLEIAQNYTADEYNKVIAKRGSWAILYHFSNVRENIVASMPITKNDKVLEIGAGCGAITGILSKMAAEVEAVELSMKRTMINANRHRDCDNVRIRVGNFQDIEKKLPNDYDVITLIGVFEYAKSYIDAEDPYVEFLRIIKRHLAPGGRLILAIENKFGLKYFAGCREDHTQQYFDGIEGYRETSHVRTFGRRELAKMIAAAGFDRQDFYYPYPDYKLPEVIFSDDYLPKANELTMNHRNFDFDRVEIFDENKVYAGLIEEGLFSEFSNSFLVVAQGE